MAYYPPPPTGRGRPGPYHPHLHSPYEVPTRGRGTFSLRSRGWGRGRGALATHPSPVTEAEIHPRFDINGVSFELVNRGSKLQRLTRTSQSCHTHDHYHNCIIAIAGQPETPPQHEIAGVKFYRTKGGNLLRHKEYIELQEKQYDLRSLGQSILTRGRKHKVKKTTEPCSRFSQTGQCTRDCLYAHDFNKVAACRTYLMQRSCPAGDDCSLSHDLTPNRTPMCMFFARGSCTHADCQYTHVKPLSGAPVCYPFGKYGYCDAGADCKDLHVFECPSFANTGRCPDKGCRLQHVERAGQLRKRAGAINGGSNENSDENPDAQHGDEDPDSDDAVDHPAISIADGTLATSAFSQQNDFIGFGEA